MREDVAKLPAQALDFHRFEVELGEGGDGHHFFSCDSGGHGKC
jgi:hypothetical protein